MAIESSVNDWMNGRILGEKKISKNLIWEIYNKKSLQ